MTAAANITALVLAAGRSQRMGKRNKLLVPLCGQPLIRWTVRAALQSAATSVVVVTGHEAEAVSHALDGLPVKRCFNPAHDSGLASSLITGIDHIDPSTDGVLICLGDMPAVHAQDLDALIAAYDPARGCEICVPVHRGRRGNPVLWGQRFFGHLRRLKGDRGARALLGTFQQAVCDIDLPHSPGVVMDIDTPNALQVLREQLGGGTGLL